MIRVEETLTERGCRLVASVDLNAGQAVARLTGFATTSVPSYRTIQVAEDSHLDDLGNLAYLNHACRPNTRIRIEPDELLVETVVPVRAGDELTFFYPSTEWDMARPFRCCCDAPDCLGRIAGARHLSLEALSRHQLAPHILRLLARR